MTKPAEATDTLASLREKIIVALDVDSAVEARAIASELRGHVGAVKVGLQLFAAAGPSFVRELVAAGHRVFLDLKFHDIPNTVAKASVEAARMGVWMFNVHAAGGSEMMHMTAASVGETCDKEGIEKPLIIGVTVLTSSNAETLSETGLGGKVEEQVTRLAKLASNSGLDGVVASPHEVAAIRRTVENPNFLIVTPGIRPNAATGDDQKRVTTLGRAVSNGSNYVVVGRPITQAADRVAAVERLISEV